MYWSRHEYIEKDLIDLNGIPITLDKTIYKIYKSTVHVRTFVGYDVCEIYLRKHAKIKKRIVQNIYICFGITI